MLKAGDMTNDEIIIESNYRQYVCRKCKEYFIEDDIRKEVWKSMVEDKPLHVKKT